MAYSTHAVDCLVTLSYSITNVLFFQHGLTYQSSILQHDTIILDKKFLPCRFFVSLILNFVFWDHVTYSKSGNRK